ncbi:MAG TPA: HNH endonuclease [Acidimicrobiales bacterium]|jgi:5-methylcytosine-specific restriction endonuclease McrA|nr:HNH endonuclease [Acidimicrobiales bacterium]HMS89215.1 HNH endonuclease [Acidimicrobiales bacterium]HRA35662.1 HNH endonuclease [Acidimicrobiales bacterium]
MVRALVLNATYEPLAVVTARRAVVLVLAEKADSLDGSGQWFHAERLALEVPSVIRLRTVVRVDRHRELSISRRGVLARDEHRCQYCGARAETLDHVVPRSRGGGHTWDNVVAACRPCNVHKADRLLPDTRLELRRPPVVPRRTAWVTVLVEQVPEAWRPWLPAAA